MKEKYTYEEELDLVRKAQKGDTGAMELLLRKYEPLFRKLTAGETFMDWEDIRQELVLSFLEGVKAYDPDRGIYFGFYMKQKLYWKKNHLIAASTKRRGREVHNLEETEEMGKEDTYGEEDLSRRLYRVAEHLSLPPEEKIIFAGLMKGEKPACLIQKTGGSRSSYYRFRASLMDRLRKNRDLQEA